MIKEKVLRDGHIHTPFCPHGSKDPLHEYVEQAKKSGLEVMSFTEHMPLPEGVLEENLARMCSPDHGVMLDYFKAVEEVKKAYEGEIVVATGLEVDYIEGYEKETKRILNLYGPYIQDGLLSVHILKVKDKCMCVDQTPEVFGEIAMILGSVEAVYDLYYKTVLKAVKADLGPYKPKRLAHLSLVRVFQKAHPYDYENDELLEELVRAIKEKGYAVDFNTGGLRKDYCRELYPDHKLRALIDKYEVPIVWGSDSHRAQDVGYGFGEIPE